LGFSNGIHRDVAPPVAWGRESRTATLVPPRRPEKPGAIVECIAETVGILPELPGQWPDALPLQDGCSACW